MRLNDREIIWSKGRCDQLILNCNAVWHVFVFFGEYICQVDVASNVLYIDNVVVHCFPDCIFLYGDMTETFCGGAVGPVNTCHAVVKDSDGILLWHVYVKDIELQQSCRCPVNGSIE
eukprot:11085628-Ditylum_brightwellii.AAC.1